MELRMWAEGAWLSLVSPFGGPLLRLVLQFEGAWLSLSWAQSLVWAQRGTSWGQVCRALPEGAWLLTVSVMSGVTLHWAQLEGAWLSMVSQLGRA